MDVYIKNFFRTDMSLLTAKSIKHFWPNSKIHILCLYKNEEPEYLNDDLSFFDSVIYRQTKFTCSNGGSANPLNCSFFSEGYNFIFEEIKNDDKKWLILAEDHFFTKGIILRSLEENDFDIAWAEWNKKDGNMNASIICLNPSKFDNLVLNENGVGVESYFKEFFVRPNLKTFQMPCRSGDNYGGDGLYTNCCTDIERELRKVGII